LLDGRLPKKGIETPDGIRARFDPVSLGALLASIGQFTPLAEVSAMLLDAAKEALPKNQQEVANNEDSTGSQNENC
jgi:hypothetical protein